jgi:hypothetical protein
VKKGKNPFDDKGNQQSGTGEYIVCLRPMRQDEQVLPQARLAVWHWTTDGQGKRQWKQMPVAGQPELIVQYNPSYIDQR